jgi:hypothetical protein
MLLTVNSAEVILVVLAVYGVVWVTHLLERRGVAPTNPPADRARA